MTFDLSMKTEFATTKSGGFLIPVLPAKKSAQQTEITTTATTATDHTLATWTCFVRLEVVSGDRVRFVYDEASSDGASFTSSADRWDLSLASWAVQDIALPEGTTKINYVTESGNSTVIEITEW